MPTERDQTRERVIAAAADLLARGGRDAVTTRAIAAAAGVQAPTLYRLFGDKDGLVGAVAEHTYAAFVAAKRAEPPAEDPLSDLRAGWDLAVGFGLEHPALYALMYADPARPRQSPALQAGMAMLRAKIDRLAAAGWLRVDAPLAAGIIHATARGAVLTWLSLAEHERDPALLTALREAMVLAVTYEAPQVPAAGPEVAARALRASLAMQPGRTTLSRPEQDLLAEWLDRIERGSVT